MHGVSRFGTRRSAHAEYFSLPLIHPVFDIFYAMVSLYMLIQHMRLRDVIGGCSRQVVNVHVRWHAELLSNKKISPLQTCAAFILSAFVTLCRLIASFGECTSVW